MTRKPLPIRDLELRHGGESYITPDRQIYYSAKLCQFMPTAKVLGVLPNGALIIKDHKV